MEELRASLEAESIDEEHEEYALDTTIQCDAKLSDAYATQKCSGDTAQDEVTYFQFSDKIPECNGNEKRYQRLVVQYLVYEFHCLST